MSNRFIEIERDKTHEIPVKEWLAEGHLARFVADMVNPLDLSRLEGAYKGGGSAPYPPAIRISQIHDMPLGKDTRRYDCGLVIDRDLNAALILKSAASSAVSVCGENGSGVALVA